MPGTLIVGMAVLVLLVIVGGVIFWLTNQKPPVRVNSESELRPGVYEVVQFLKGEGTGGPVILKRSGEKGRWRLSRSNTKLTKKNRIIFVPTKRHAGVAVVRH